MTTQNLNRYPQQSVPLSAKTETGTPTSTSASRYTLRDLPLSAKLVVTVFLLSVGLGYLSALVQLHFKGGAKDGNPLPTSEDTVARFSGIDLNTWWNNREFGGKSKPAEPPADTTPEDDKTKGGAGPQAVNVPAAAVTNNTVRVNIKEIIKKRCETCHSPDGEQSDHPLTNYEELKPYLKFDGESCKLLDMIVQKPEESKWGKTSMSRAWTNKDEEWDDIKKKPADELKKELARRETERLAVVAWLKKEKADEKLFDDFPLPPELKGQPIDDAFIKKTTAGTGTQSSVAVDAPKKKPAKVVGPHDKAEKNQIKIDTLTQSTHAHLLTFCVLFGSTGLIFAFSSYPGWIRGFLAPVVLTAQVADIACWWLARLDGIGPFFALAIAATGGIVGLGLCLQILLSVFNLYELRGKVVVFLLLLAGGAVLGTVAGPAYKAMLDKEAKDALPTQPSESPEPAKTVAKPAEPVAVAEKPADPPKTMPKIEE